MVQDAFSKALERWPEDGVPPNPAGWVATSARRRAIDLVREAHYLAGGNVVNVVRALIAADKAAIDLRFKQATAIDLAA